MQIGDYCNLTFLDEQKGNLLDPSLLKLLEYTCRADEQLP